MSNGDFDVSELPHFSFARKACPWPYGVELPSAANVMLPLSVLLIINVAGWEVCTCACACRETETLSISSKRVHLANLMDSGASVRLWEKGLDLSKLRDTERFGGLPEKQGGGTLRLCEWQDGGVETGGTDSQQCLSLPILTPLGSKSFQATKVVEASRKR